MGFNESTLERSQHHPNPLGPQSRFLFPACFALLQGGWGGADWLQAAGAGRAGQARLGFEWCPSGGGHVCSVSWGYQQVIKCSFRLALFWVTLILVEEWDEGSPLLWTEGRVDTGDSLMVTPD